MRRDVDGAQIGDMIGGVIGLVFAYRDASAALLGFGLEHGLRSVALSGAVGERDHACHRQPMLVLHGGVAHVAELRLPPGRLAVKPAVAIGRARMRVFPPLLPLADDSTLSTAPPVLRPTTLIRSPSCGQC